MQDALLHSSVVKRRAGVQGRAFTKDCSPNLPATLGPTVPFVTLSASLPPRTRTCVCRFGRTDADRQPGFVFLASADSPHPNPDEWLGVTLLLPLASERRKRNWLCTQGFGGAGHHRGASMHHACDFSCSIGTPLVAVADGVVILVRDDATIGAGRSAIFALCAASRKCSLPAQHVSWARAMMWRMQRTSTCFPRRIKLRSGWTRKAWSRSICIFVMAARSSQLARSAIRTRHRVRTHTHAPAYR